MRPSAWRPPTLALGWIAASALMIVPELACGGELLRLVAAPYEEAGWPFPDWGSPDPLAGDPFPDELLRFGVQFADGRRVTNMDSYPFVPEDLPPDQPVLIAGGGVGSEGGGGSWTWS